MNFVTYNSSGVIKSVGSCPSDMFYIQCNNEDGTINTTELVTNGGFAADSDWAKGTGWIISDGKANFSGSSEGNLSQSLSPIAGRSYKLSVIVSAITTPGNLGLTVNLGGAASTQITENGTYVVYFTATSTAQLEFAIDVLLASDTLSIDDVSLVELYILEGTAATDGSQIVVDGEVVDDPEWEEPVAPVENQTVEQRLERLENPYPATLTVTFSGIVVNSATDDPLVAGVATDFNGTFVLTQDNPGTNTYSYSSGEKRIYVELGRYVSNAIQAYLFGSTDSGVAFHHGGDTFRGRTYDNDGGVPNYNSAGKNGTVFIA